MELDLVSMVLLLLIWPLVLSLLTVIKIKHKWIFYLVSIVSTASLAVAVCLYGPRSEPVRLGEWVCFSLDRSSWLFVIIIYACWSITLIYSKGYIASHLSSKAQLFHKYMNATITLSIGAGLADNFFTLLFFYIASILTIIPLLTIRGGVRPYRAANYYIRSTLWPALLIAVPVIVWNFPLQQSFDQIHIQELGWSHLKSGLVLALMVIGLSKNCVAPFHLWLPGTAMAPAPITAMIHSVAAVQMGSIALFKIGTQVYGLELLSDLCDHFFESGWLIYLFGFTAIYTAYRAWKTQDLKERFSFSTVGQLSYVLTAILIGTPQSMQGALLHIITHSIAKLNLFFCAGAYLTCFGSVQAAVVAKAIPRKRWLGIAAVLSGLSISGFPFLVGYYSKDVMLLEEIHRHHYAAAGFLLLGSAINFVYIYPLIRATLSRASGDAPAPKPLHPAMTLAIGICTLALLIMSVFSFVLMRWTELSPSLTPH